MNSLYNTPEISGIFLQAVDQHYVNRKEEIHRIITAKQKHSEEEFTEKQFITSNFDFLNDSTDIDTSNLDDDGSRKYSSDFSSNILKEHNSSLDEQKKLQLSSSLCSTYHFKIKHQKDKIYTQLKEFIANSNYMQINGFYTQNLQPKFNVYNNYGKSFSTLEMNSMMNMNYNNMFVNRSRCNSYPTNNGEIIQTESVCGIEENKNKSSPTIGMNSVSGIKK